VSARTAASGPARLLCSTALFAELRHLGSGSARGTLGLTTSRGRRTRNPWYVARAIAERSASRQEPLHISCSHGSDASISSPPPRLATHSPTRSTCVRCAASPTGTHASRSSKCDVTKPQPSSFVRRASLRERPTSIAPSKPVYQVRLEGLEPNNSSQQNA